jgi:hypothetical protein
VCWRARNLPEWLSAPAEPWGFEISPIESYPRCLLDVPFSHGLIALSATQQKI